jgi:hypothetical protein
MPNLTFSVNERPATLRRAFEEHGILVFADALSSQKLRDLNAEIAAHYKPIVETPSARKARAPLESSST